MTSRTALALVLTTVTLFPALAGCSREPRTAKEVVTRSVQAHGGDRLTTWRTLNIKGTVRMQDGIAYNAAFLLTASAPDRIRVEQDLTADRGRRFFEYFLDGGVAWTRSNLVVSEYDAARMQRWMDLCYGIAFYARQSDAMALKPDADVTWTPPAADGAPAAPMTRRTWVVAATVGGEARELFLDKETYHLIKEVTPGATRVYWDFKTFDGRVVATRILETTKNRQGVEQQMPFTYTSVTFDAPVEDWIFTEDKPAKR